MYNQTRSALSSIRTDQQIWLKNARYAPHIINQARMRAGC